MNEKTNDFPRIDFPDIDACRMFAQTRSMQTAFQKNDFALDVSEYLRRDPPKDFEIRYGEGHFGRDPIIPIW